MKTAVYAGTRNLYKSMIPAIKSLICNSDVEKIYLLIEDETFPYELPDICETIDVSHQTFFIKNGPNMNSRYTYMTMMRAVLSKILPVSLDRVLSLDVDTIVDKDISDLWNLPIDEYYFAGVHEWHTTTEKFLYVNAGVVLFNLKKMRDGKTDELIQILNTRKYGWVEQDALNIFCQGYIYDMPPEYNQHYYSPKVDIPKIIHHIGDNKKLPDYPDVQKYSKMTFEDCFRMRKK